MLLTINQQLNIKDKGAAIKKQLLQKIVEIEAK
jgi:hypothetical protein